MFDEEKEIEATLNGIESCLLGEGNVRLDRKAAAIILAALIADVVADRDEAAADEARVASERDNCGDG